MEQKNELRDQLIASALGDQQDEEAFQKLSEYLQSHPEDCPELFRHCRMHGDLAYLIGAGDAEERVLNAIGAEVLMPHQKSTGASRRSVVRRSLGLLVLAASLAVIAAVTNFEAEPEKTAKDLEVLRHPTIVATVVSADDAVWREREYGEGTSMRDETDLRLQTGTVRVNLPSGVELVLYGPCDVSLDSPSQIQLRSGRVTARVADWAPKVVLNAGAFKVFSLGNHLAVEADSQGNLEAHALEGNIRIEPMVPIDSARKSFVVAEGEAIRSDAKHLTTESIPLNPERFAVDYAEFRPYRTIPLHNSGIGLTVGDEDPNWRIVEGAVGEGYQGPQFAVVCEPDQRYWPNRPSLSQWMSVAKDLRPGCLPNSSYTFRTEFDLTGFEISTVMILADMLADNGVKSVRINGNPVELEPWRDNEYLQTFHQFRRAEIRNGFVEGSNTIEIDVWNGIYHFDPNQTNSNPTPNPMSLRVEWQAFGIPRRLSAEANSI